MKSKFLYVCSDDWDTLPTQKDLKAKLKCKEVFELSNDTNEMLEISDKTRYKAGPLSKIYSDICSRRSYYFSLAWGVDSSNQYSRRNRKVFLISDDVDHKYLTSLMLKASYTIRAFTLNENGTDSINSHIECYIHLHERIKEDYKDYKTKRDKAIAMVKNVSPEIDATYFDNINNQETEFLDLCNRQADVYMSKIIDALANGWS